MNDFLMRIVEKKLLDKNYQVTQEEIIHATLSLEERITIAQLCLDVLRGEQELLNKFIEERKKHDGAT